MACISLFGFHRVSVQCVWSMILKKGYCNITCAMYLALRNFLEAAMVIALWLIWRCVTWRVPFTLVVYKTIVIMLHSLKLLIAQGETMHITLSFFPLAGNFVTLLASVVVIEWNRKCGEVQTPFNITYTHQTNLLLVPVRWYWLSYDSWLINTISGGLPNC